MNMRLGVVLGAAVVVAIAACGSSSMPTCVTVPQTIPNDRLVTSGARITVPVGAIVFVVLVEPGHYTTKRGFPWLTPTTSNRSVLAPVRLCKRPVASTLPLSVTGFRAIQRGATTVTARLAPGWPGSFKPGPEPSRNVVSVR